MDNDKIENTDEQKELTTMPTTSLSLNKELSRKLKQELRKINKKDFGRDITVDELVIKAIGLLNESHIKELQEATLTNADKIDREYLKYCKEHGGISKDQYLGILLNGSTNGGKENEKLNDKNLKIG